MLKKMKAEILNKRDYFFSKAAIYRNQSLFFEYLINNQVLAISYNSLDEKIYIYYRSKQDISYYEEYMRDLNFTLSNHLLVYEAKKKSHTCITVILLEALNRVEGLLKAANIEVSQYDSTSRVMNGFYLDTNNNHVVSANSSNGPSVSFVGENNYLEIQENVNLKNLKIVFYGSNSRVVVKKNVQVSGEIVVKGKSQVLVDDAVISEGRLFIYCGIDHGIRIHSGCFFEGENIIRSTERYSLKDPTSNVISMKKKDIIIGTNVYIAYGAKLLSGSDIGKGAVIEEYSIVDNIVEGNTLISGSPAKVLRKGVSWLRNEI